MGFVTEILFLKFLTAPWFTVTIQISPDGAKAVYTLNKLPVYHWANTTQC